ncbi:MAG: nucleotidyltransferase domain-containing protein [Dehalococcoidia bacterium]
MVTTATDITEIVRSVVDDLADAAPVQQAILFGSYASGDARKWSDIDLAIISPAFSNVPMWRRQELLAELLPEADVRLSPLGYTPVELANPTLFLREIIRTGKVVYTSESS